jgi:glycosyltransferase involved in cell wall biosynthesis
LSAKRIPLLFLFPGFDHERPVTGGEKYNSIMIQAALADPRFEATVDPALRPLPVGVARHVALRRIWYQLRCLATVLRHRPHMLVSDASLHSWVLLAVLFARVFKPYCRIVIMAFHLRFVVSRRAGIGLWIESLSERLLLRLAHVNIAISEDSRQRLLQIGIAPESVAIVRPATDVPLAPEPPSATVNASDEVRLLYVGQCDERKGVIYLIQALAALSHLSFRLDLVGRYHPQSAYYQKVVRLIQRSHLEGRVHWAGFVTEQERAAYYQQADLFVLPSLHEGYGIVLIEAMSYGLPVIASRVSSIPELVVDGETGLLTPPAAPELLAQALEQLISAPQVRREMGIRAWNRALALYRTWPQVAGELSDLLFALGQSHRPE